MGKLIYSMGVSLDGYVADRDGEIDWTVPDDELHRFHNDRCRKLGAHLLGRKLYEAMTYWETVDMSSSDPEHEIEVEFARIWLPLPKVVFSKTLTEVEGTNYRLAGGDLAEEVARLREETDGDLGIGGAGLAAAAIEQGLVDDFQPFVYPVVLGAGTPFLPGLEERINMELVETRTFPSKVVYLHYRRV